MGKEYGGFFCETIEEKLLVEDNEKCLYFDSARSAIRFLLKNKVWTKKRVLLPDYLCESMLMPFEDYHFEVHFYPIRRDFSIDTEKLNEIVRNVEPDLLYVMSYFGFDTLQNAKDLINNYQKQDIRILEDVTHSYYGEFDSFTPDYKIGSFRKWCGLEEGGFLWSSSLQEGMMFYEHRSSMINTNVLDLKKTCFDKKREYLNYNEQNDYVNLYEKSEWYLDTQVEIYSMSESVRKKLWIMGTDEIKKKRIHNFKLISERLKNIEGIIPTKIDRYEMGVPLYFPMYMEEGKRDFLRKCARDYDIYLPIIWPKSLKVDKYFVENRIYENILCVPCDQRWEAKDILYMCDVIEKIMEEQKS